MAESLPTTNLGHYKVRSKIGSGGMGDVYDATHTGLNKRVAIKTLRTRYLDDEIVVARFLREGQLASRVRHPNIVDVSDVGMMGGLPCLVMEHLEGESLSGLLKRENKLSLDRLVDILLPIIAAVDFAHDHGIVHRDLKPSNIFLSRAWNGEIVPKVLDFGISKLVHDSQQTALTTDSAFVGTPHYASPELMRADKLVDGRSDQYSMGVILYEATTGQRPFADHGNNFVALAMAICKGEFASPREKNPAIPAAFEAVIKRSMGLEAADRFLTMRALGEALLPFAGERERVIWAPTFRGQSGDVSIVSSSGGNKRQPVSQATIPSRPPASGGALPPSSVPSVIPAPAPLPSGAISVPPSPISSHPGFYNPHANAHPSTTPPGAAFDRLPSYGGASYSGGNPTYGGAPPARGSGFLYAALGGTIVVGLALGVMLVRPKHDESKAPPAAAAPSPAAFSVDVQVTPATATIEVDGVPTGAGRFVRSFVSDGQKHVLRISAPQYENVLIEFDNTRPPPASITLRAIPSDPKPAGHGPQPRPGTGTPSKGKGADRPKTDNIDPWE